MKAKSLDKREWLAISILAMLRSVHRRSRQAPGGSLHVWQSSSWTKATSLTVKSHLNSGSSVSFGDNNVHFRYLSTTSSQPCRHGSEDPPSSYLHPVYVHIVSKTVLQHLQDRRSDWLIANGLDRGLHVNANGTFVLKFPSRPGVDSGRIW